MKHLCQICEVIDAEVREAKKLLTLMNVTPTGLKPQRLKLCPTCRDFAFTLQDSNQFAIVNEVELQEVSA